MRTLEEDDFDSRTTLPRVPAVPLILELTDDDFRRGVVGGGATPAVEPGLRARVSMQPLVKKPRVWPVIVFVALAAASVGIALGAPPNWKENAAAKFAGSVTISDATLAPPKPREEPPAPPPPPAPPATVKPMSVAASAPQLVAKPQAAAVVHKVAPKLAPKIAAPEAKSATDDDPYEVAPAASKPKAPEGDEVEASKPAPAAPEKSSEPAATADPPSE